MYENYQLSFDFMTEFEDNGKLIGKVGIFKTKKCTKCNRELEATKENYRKHSTTKDKLNSWCRECTNKLTKEISNKKVKQGIYCKFCTEPKLPNSMKCAYHHVQAVVNSQIHGGRFQQLKTKDQRHYYVKKLIEKLEQQEYKCAISGVPIELGVNASLDHIQNFSQGGTCTLENLQWVDKLANSCKPRKYKHD